MQIKTIRIPASELHRSVFVLVLLAALLSCSSNSNDPFTQPPSDCEVVSQNQYVFDLMKDFYFWYKEVLDVDPAQFASPEELLAELIYSRLDRFSGISDQQKQALFLGQGKFVGVGLRLKIEDTGRMFVSLPFSGSPAAEAGIVRGTEIISINGNPVSSLVTGEDFDDAWGDTSVGTTATLELLSPDASSIISVTLTREVVTIDSTQVVDTFTDDNGVKFGYLLFTNFFGGGTSTTPLSKVFASFKDENIDQLILDLRYNGGGSVDTAVHLGSLMGGLFVTDTSDEDMASEEIVFAKTIYSDRYSDFNETKSFRKRTESISLSKIYIITTDATCSASEMLINALKPHMDVVTIGESTCGKPVGFNPQNFCDKTINAVNFEFRNSLNEGEFYDGLPASCNTTDDLSQTLGDPQENAVAIASYYQQNNQCPAAQKTARRAVSAGRKTDFDRRPYMRGIY